MKIFSTISSFFGVILLSFNMVAAHKDPPAFDITLVEAKKEPRKISASKNVELVKLFFQIRGGKAFEKDIDWNKIHVVCNEPISFETLNIFRGKLSEFTNTTRELKIEFSKFSLLEWSEKEDIDSINSINENFSSHVFIRFNISDEQALELAKFIRQNNIVVFDANNDYVADEFDGIHEWSDITEKLKMNIRSCGLLLSGSVAIPAHLLDEVSKPIALDNDKKNEGRNRHSALLSSLDLWPEFIKNMKNPK